MTTYNKVEWRTTDSLTSDKLAQMAGNTDYLNERKVDGVLRNTAPDYNNRTNIQLLDGNVVIYAEYREISPPATDGGVYNHPAFTKQISFPENFFNSTFLPVVVATIGIKSANAIKTVTHNIKEITASGFKVEIRENTNKKFADTMVYYVNYIAIGVKG